MLQGPDYYVEDTFKLVIDKLLSEIPDKSYIANLPFDTLYKIINHADKTHFVTVNDSELNIPDIIGPYSLYDENRLFLCRINLHSNIFGETLVEKAYIDTMSFGQVLYLSYVSSDNEVRDIQVMKL